MSPAGIFKTLLWLAPVLGTLFYFITLKQEKHSAQIEKESSQFDADFAQMSSELSRSDNGKVYWQKKRAGEEERLKDLSDKVDGMADKNDKAVEDMEKSLNEMNLDEFKK